MLRCEDANESLIGMKASLYLKIFNNQKRPHCGRFFIFILVKISFILYLVRTVWEEEVVQIDKVVVGHTCDIVNDELIGLCCLVRSSSFVVNTVYLVDMLGVYRGVLVLSLQVIE